MRRISFNQDWRFWRVGEEDAAQCVTLPHDAMLAQGRSAHSPGGANISFFQGGDYIYQKTFTFGAEAAADVSAPAGSRIIAEFEGVYRNAEVWLNERRITGRAYGYTQFQADLTEALQPGENTLRVAAYNAGQPNSRWYTGSGIYRPVSLYVLPAKHILPDGVQVRTRDHTAPAAEVTVHTSDPGRIRIGIARKGETQCLYSAEADTAGLVTVNLPLPGAALWSPESPSLYVCRVDFGEDSTEVVFGVRTVECTPEKGFCINGRRVILRGACVHHDNGLLGAVADPYAEARKVRLLRQAGYNAIRSAHNPCSRALLEACDEQGMLVMDEYVDMWYIHKTRYDYADSVEKHWPQDLADMVRKDISHPSVVLYSIGNEVAETGQKRGIDLTRRMTEHLHALDDSRPVTCGVNIFFNYLFSLGFGVYSDKKAEQQAKSATVKTSVGSEFYNNLAGILGAKFMKLGATLHGSDVKTRDAFACMDVAGYNYGEYRYRRDLAKYPRRIILGTETFCADAYRFWERAKQHPALIGDFVWAGMDYLGEAGIGAWEYKAYAPDFNHGPGWITAGSGRLDITGRSGGELLYTRVAFELDELGLAVVPALGRRQAHSPSAWKLTNAIPSWSFSGHEGQSATVEVYTRAASAALYVNGKRVAQKKRGRDCRIVFKAVYQPGVLEARAYDAHGRELARTALKTAADDTRLTLLPEEKAVTQGGLCYVRIRYTDAAGIIKPLVRGRVHVRVENGMLLGLGHACAYNQESYLSDSTDTYYGEALAIIRPVGNAPVHVTADSPHGSAAVSIAIQERKK